MSPALTVSGLSFSYGRAQVLDDVSFDVGDGEIVTIIGPNGAGKSTLLNVVARSHRLKIGDVTIRGTGTNGMAQRAVVKLGCVLVPEGRQVFSSQSVEDNLLLGGYTQRRHSERIHDTLETVYMHFPRLLERKDQLAGTLSGGEQQMLAIGRALMSGPKVMLLDEPSLGLAPQMTDRIMRILGDLRHETGLSIVLVEQNANAALALADRGYLLSGGRVILEGSSSDLKQDKTIQQVYLGGAASTVRPASR